MPGIATHFKILDLTIDRLSASGNADLEQIATVMKDNSPYAYLGAIGPALADFIPSDPSNNFAAIWKGVFLIVGGDGSAGNPGLLKILDAFMRFFEKIQPILDDEDLFALKAMRDNGDIDEITAMANALSTTITNLTKPDGYLTTVQGQIGAGGRPIVNYTYAPDTAAPETWTAREYLFWQKTGAFAKALLDRAEASGDNRFKAYAYGYISAYSSFIAGSSFVNSIIGGTYRSDWWRYRWIDNFVDAWVYGFYETGASMSGDTPSPSYGGWRALCNAQLQTKIELPGLDPDAITADLTNAVFQIIPAEFENFWYSAFEEVYGVRTEASRFKPNTINGAYLLTWMMLWLQTSGRVVGCNIAPPMTPPDGADTPPSWIDPAVPGDNGAGQIAPTPSVETDVDEGKIISGILLALLGLGLLAAGGLAAGGVAIAFGVETIIVGANEINWAKLRVDIYWYRLYLYNGLKALHEVMVLGTFQHPYPLTLETGDAVTLLGFEFPFDSAVLNCKSQSTERFPPAPWDGVVGFTSLWIDRPSGRGVEEPATTPYLSMGKYPNFFVDDDANNPLTTATDIKTKDPITINGDGGNMRTQNVAGGKIPVQFANAVANNIDLYVNRTFPNWNLDSDRGLAYLTWKFKNGYANPVVIQPE